MRPCQRRGEGRPAGGDGKQFLKPAFAASLSQARVPSRVKLPAPAASGIVYTEGSSDKGGPEARPRAQKPGAQGQGGSLPTGYFSTQDLKGKTSRPLENLKAVFVYLKALPKRTAPGKAGAGAWAWGVWAERKLRATWRQVTPVGWGNSRPGGGRGAERPSLLRET